LSCIPAAGLCQRNGKNGFIFESGSLNALVQKINTLSQEKEKLKLMGLHSSQMIQQWSFESICETIEKKIGY
jgi:hypothetical protein